MASSYIHIALVTGANQGIGYEIAKKLLTEHKNYHVIVTSRRKEAVDEAVEKLKAETGSSTVEGLWLDVTLDDSIAAAAKQVADKHGHLDVLINNAAILLEDGRNSRPDWARVFDTNVFGVVQTTEAFIPLLDKSTSGSKRIVMMSSTIGSMTMRDDKTNEGHHTSMYTPYAASKSALNMLALHYAIKYEGQSEWKINVNCPGYCNTNLTWGKGFDTAEQGAINAVRLATLGPDGETGKWSDRHGPIPW